MISLHVDKKINYSKKFLVQNLITESNENE
jgi:hypothetical protein